MHVDAVHHLPTNTGRGLLSSPAEATLQKKYINIGIIGGGPIATNVAVATLATTENTRVTIYEMDLDRLGRGVGFQKSNPRLYHRSVLTQRYPDFSSIDPKSCQPFMKNILEDERLKAIHDHPSGARSVYGEQGEIMMRHLPKERSSIVNSEVCSVDYNPRDRTYAMVLKNATKAPVSPKLDAICYCQGKRPRKAPWKVSIEKHGNFVNNIWDDPKKTEKILSSLSGNPHATLIIVGGGETSFDSIIKAVLEHNFIGLLNYVMPEDRRIFIPKEERDSPKESRAFNIMTPQVMELFNEATSKIRCRLVFGRAVDSFVTNDEKLAIIVDKGSEKKGRFYMKSAIDMAMIFRKIINALVKNEDKMGIVVDKMLGKKRRLYADAVVDCTGWAEGMEDIALYQDAQAKGFIENLHTSTFKVNKEHEQTIFGADLVNFSIPNNLQNNLNPWMAAAFWANNLERHCSENADSITHEPTSTT